MRVPEPWASAAANIVNNSEVSVESKAMPLLRTFVCLSLAVLTGCQAQQPAQPGDKRAEGPERGEFVELTDSGEILSQTQQWVTTAWVWSHEQEVARAVLPDGSLQPDERDVGVRLSVGSIRPDKDGVVPLLVEFMNHTRKPMTALKPFADWYLDNVEGIQLFGPHGPCRYSGPTPSYQLGESAFVRLDYGESVWGQGKLQLENFDNTDAPGIYTLYFVYQAHPGHRQRATELGFENLYSGGWRCGPLAILVGDVEQETVFEDNISLWVPAGGYSWSVNELAAGIEVEWEVRVGKDFDDVVTYSTRGEDIYKGLKAHAEIFGNDQYYGLNDFGHPGPPQYKRQPVRKGIYKGQLDWDGKNWNGPSDFDAPKGDAFPPGDYQLQLTLHGMVDTGRGRRPFSIEHVVPVTVTE